MQAKEHLDESHSTLRFASRAKRVVNNAVVNEVQTLLHCAVFVAPTHILNTARKSPSSRGLNTPGLSFNPDRYAAQVLSDAAVLKRQAREIEQLRKKLGANGCAFVCF